MSSRSSFRIDEFLGTLREAVAGGEVDGINLPIGRAVTLLAIPMVLEMVMESVFAVTDVFFVAKLGVEAVAAVGMTEALVTIVYAIAVGLSMSTTAMVARRIGEKNIDGANEAAVQAMALGTLVALCIAVPGVYFAPRLLAMMGGQPELVAMGKGYTQFILGGNLVIVQLFLINAVFRGTGDAALAMRVLWLSNGVNIILDPCLIFGWGPFPELGLTGAAVATNIGRGLGVVYQLTLLGRGRGVLRLTRANLRLRFHVIFRLLRVSLGGIGQYLISTSSWVVLVKIVGSFGATAVAGYTIAIRIVLFALLPAWGVANAAATLVGQNLGAKQPDRAEKSVWRTGIYNSVFLATVGIIFITMAEQLVGIFTSDPGVIAVGVSCLRWFSYSYAFHAFGMVLISSFNGAGDTATPTIINFFCYWMFQLPLAYVLSHQGGFQVQGVFMSVMINVIVLTLTAAVVFRRGKWKTKVI